jgi:hypothetical protein
LESEKLIFREILTHLSNDSSKIKVHISAGDFDVKRIS